MNILIVGSGGREHAIGLKLKENPKVQNLYFASGNGGTSQLGENIVATTIEEMLSFAKGNDIQLVIVGSEELLMEGIVDCFQAAGIAILGPHQKAALLEGSKAFAKDFMLKYGIKTATYQSFSDYEKALAYLDTIEFPSVIKASGLAAGKGVIIAQNKTEAQQALQEIMQNRIFGESGSEVVIEEFLQGVEASILSFYNGQSITPFISAKDHKKIQEGETGLNTGGMGVIAPNPYVDETVLEAFHKTILTPTLKGLEAEKLQFSGVIFFGLMITKKGVYLLEYNLRMGDPETQALLPLMDSDLLTAILQTINGETVQIDWKKQASCCVVMVSGGYPQAYEKGHKIEGLEQTNTPVYIAGANLESGNYLTSGGRVLNVVGLGKNAEEARKKAYQEVAKIHFQKSFYRTDIGKLNEPVSFVTD